MVNSSLLRKGLVAACFTPFNKDGTINFKLIPPLVEKLIDDGLTGLFVCGSNGEGPNMTTQERMSVADAFVTASRNRIKIIVHVGHSSIFEAKKLTEHAAYIQADAVSAVAAFYFKPTNVANLVACMAEIASSAPEIPFFYYHIPTLTGVGMDMMQFLELAEAAIPNLIGIKYTATSIQEYQSCLNYKGGKFNLLYGYDELLLPALSVGAKAAIGSTYTFAAPLYLQTIKLFENGDTDGAMNNHAYLVELIRRIVKYSPIPAQKAIMQMIGWDLGPCRLPLQELNEKDFNELYTSLLEIDFFNKINTFQYQS